MAPLVQCRMGWLVSLHPLNDMRRFFWCDALAYTALLCVGILVLDAPVLTTQASVCSCAASIEWLQSLHHHLLQCGLSVLCVWPLGTSVC